MDNKTKFQTIGRKYTWDDLNRIDIEQNGSAQGFCDIELSLDENIDKRYNQCVGISVKTTGDFTTNVNGEVTQPILIDDVEVYPTGFDTIMLFPMEQNREFTHLKYPIPLNNSKCEGRVKFHFSGFGTEQPTDHASVMYNPQVVLHLESGATKKEDVKLSDIMAELEKITTLLSNRK